MLAYLSPIIGIVEYFRIKETGTTYIEKRRFLITSRLKALIIVAQALIILGLLISIATAYKASNSQTLFDALNFEDFAVSILKGLMFGAVIATSGIIQIKQFFKWQRTIPIILICFLVIILNTLSILLIDYGISVMMF